MRLITMGEYPVPETSKPSENRLKMRWEWYVLDIDEGRALLLSRDVVDWEFYSGDNSFLERAKPSSWEKCYVRQLLNEDFYKKCFTGKEKTAILTNDTCDRLFLLTADEVRKYLPQREYRLGEILFYEENGEGKSLFRDRIKWWLNTVGAKANMMQVVDEDGDVDEEGLYNDSDEVGVRPAMWIKWYGDRRERFI